MSKERFRIGWRQQKMLDYIKNNAGLSKFDKKGCIKKGKSKEVFETFFPAYIQPIF